MRVTLLGTGDTTGTPTPGCECETCQRARRAGVERSRFSVHVRAAGESLLVDTSPDFRHQFLARDVPLPDAAVITHVHYDHLDGLGNVYRLIDDLPLYAAGDPDPELGHSVATHVEERYGYLADVTVHHESPFEPFDVGPFAVTLVPVVHPPLSSYGLRVEGPAGATLAISGDTSYAIDADARAVLGGADLALVDGLVTADQCSYHPLGGDHHDEAGVPLTFGTKHMTLEGARRLAADIDAADYRVVHTAHYVPAEDAFAEDIAVDGESFDL